MNSFCCLIFAIIIVISELTNAQSPPSISQKSFQFFEQVIDENRKTISTHRVLYNYDYKLIRIDMIPTSGDLEGIPIRMTRDFNTGVQYSIETSNGKCSYSPSVTGIESISLVAGGTLKDPNQLFYLDNSVFKTERSERNIVCKVFESNRTDFRSPLLGNQPQYWTMEVATMREDQTEEGTDSDVSQPPISIKIRSSPEMNERYTINIFDISASMLLPSRFDIGTCFKSKEKYEFAIQFPYPQGITIDQTRMLENKLSEAFYQTALSKLSDMNVTPLRLTWARFRLHKNGFELFSGITNPPPAIQTIVKADMATKEEIYRAMENLIIKREFKLSASVEATSAVYTGNDIYFSTLDATTTVSNSSFGTSGFFKLFKIYSTDKDFYVKKIEDEGKYSIRSRKGVSSDECARLCVTEPSFKCESMSYEPFIRDCKWSSVYEEFFNELANEYVINADSYTILVGNSLSNFIHYPFTISANTDLKEVVANNDEECAYKCNSESKFKCRSFNFCKLPNGDKVTYKCLLSDAHNNNPNNNANTTFSPLCDHYSKNNLDDFKIAQKMKLNAKPQSEYFKTNVQFCAALCIYAEEFLCRSFDFFTDTQNCLLYKENYKEGASSGVILVPDENANHYSRDYFQENGENGGSNKKSSKTAKFGSGTIAGVVIAIILVGLVIGAVGTIVVKKFILTGSSPSIPEMSTVSNISFKNPSSD